MRFEPYIKAVTTTKSVDEDMCCIRLTDSAVEYENYHEHMDVLGMIACHYYEKAGGQINGSQIIGYELHIYNEYDDDDWHKVYQLPYMSLAYSR